MTGLRIWLIVLGVSVCGAILGHGWRSGLFWLVATGLTTTGFIAVAAQAGELPMVDALTRVVLVEIVSVLATTMILALSAVASDPMLATMEPGTNASAPHERTPGAPRRTRRTGLTSYLGPIFGVVLVAVMVTVLPRLYAGERSDYLYAVILLMAGGVATLVVADRMLKVGIGLQLLLHGLTLFYLGMAPRVNILSLALLKALALMFAFVIAYLCALSHQDQKTLTLEASRDPAYEDPRLAAELGTDETL